MPPIVKSPLKKLVPKKSAAPVQKTEARPIQHQPLKPTVKVAPLKSKVERPILRAFECLIHAEEAENQINMVGIFVGPDSEKMSSLQKKIAGDLKELLALYKAYWTQVSIISEPK